MPGSRLVSTQIILEGETELEVPKLEKYRTSPHEYAPSLTPVFYNPLMELSRDISVSSLQAITEDEGELRICDPLAGVGARVLRYAKEVEKIVEAIANDRSSEAVELIRRNIDRNELSSVEVRNEDANVLLHENRSRFDAIDLDPFGSPASFMDATCSALSRRSALLVTATDTAPLCGAYPKACLRRYGATPLRTPYCHELGLRILIGFCQRIGARRDLALSPILSHSTQHYFRAHLRARKGAQKANEIMKKMGYISHCFGCGRRVVSVGPLGDLPRECECGREFDHGGPMWMGELIEKGFAGRVSQNLSDREFGRKGDARKLLNLLIGEVNGPPAFYDLHEISSQVSTSPPQLRTVLNELRKRGYFASRTHFSETGLRTDAPIKELKEVVSN